MGAVAMVAGLPLSAYLGQIFQKLSRGVGETWLENRPAAVDDDTHQSKIIF